MKKIVYGFIALAAVFAGLTSCDDTNIDFPGGVDENVGPINIVVSTKGDDTRVYYQHDTDNTLKAEWEIGDKVLAISPNGTAYELAVTDIVGQYAHITGDAVRGVTVQLVYQKDISKAEWDKNGGLEVDFSEQHIDVVEPGIYQIAPAVFAGSAAIGEDGQGNGELNYLCGIVKVSAVEGVPPYKAIDPSARTVITKIALKGKGLSGGKYSYDASKEEIVYTPASRDYDEVYVANASGVVEFDATTKKLETEVFFAVPVGADLKQATVTTTESFYFHNINARPDKDEKGRSLTRLGKKVEARDYYNIVEFEEYYFTVHHWVPTVDNEPYAPLEDVRKIQFAPGNLYAENIDWGTDGVAAAQAGKEVTFHFETSQLDFRNIPNSTGVTTGNAHIGSSFVNTPLGTCGTFLWSEWSNDSYPRLQNGNNAYSKISINGYEPSPLITSPEFDTSEFWTNNANFRVENQPSDYKWRTLSGGEWQYLYACRRLPEDAQGGNNHNITFAEIDGVSGSILFHDNYIGPKEDLNYIPEGCAFLPAAGCRTATSVDPTELMQDASYWSCSLRDSGSAYVFLVFKEGGNYSYFDITNSNGRPIRMARDLPGEPANPTTE